ncbi:hypothetical protein ONS95_011739 [Cadophora gregata]|uniref:uncharacterized protein n=1 Tax=Cadophora gregata TaxID=51156 RepID=UPI0026DA8452|nr:uncharacterized protein ONS95_011739 [Cadophora gregata]KAK0120333.1 hypothetical protein ONS95_011739 [Cadophora gregata]KAK0121363.1 hypothetical protein ONS96_011538 [Cadophora gregata f. sp. sojae]
MADASRTMSPEATRVHNPTCPHFLKDSNFHTNHQNHHCKLTEYLKTVPYVIERLTFEEGYEQSADTYIEKAVQTIDDFDKAFKG